MKRFKENAVLYVGGDKSVEFEQVYIEHFTYVYKYVLSLCQNKTIAEDVTQETFFKAMKNIKTFKGTCKINVWLCQIA